MKSIKRWCLLLLTSVLILVFSYIACKNFHTVSVYVAYKHIELPLIVVALATFLSGCCLVYLLDMMVIFKQRQQLKKLNKQLDDYKQEVSQLRQSPMTEL